MTTGVAPDPDPIASHVERIEQCGDRVCITSTGIIHDIRADGTIEHGVNDVAAANGQAISVVCTFEDGVHVLRPVGMPGIEVTRRFDGDTLVWTYGPILRRVWSELCDVARRARSALNSPNLRNV